MSTTGVIADGIHAMVSPERMFPAAKKLRDIYSMTPGAPFLQREFAFFCLDRWRLEGLPPDVPLDDYFGFDPMGHFSLTGLGWCEASFVPAFEEMVLEDRGEHELVQDPVGRHVLCFKGRRSGFMPEYVDHPVKNMRSWIEKCKWRMDPNTPERYANIDDTIQRAREAACEGKMIVQRVIGGFMFLRSLIGSRNLLYMFYDEPDLIHDCMQTWLRLADAVISRHQQHLTIDEVFIAEDVCYNKGPLISPAMIREFLFPYYQELLRNIRRRQIDATRHLYFQVDTDGWAEPVIPVYRELGMDVMSPFEVASGCDVVAIGKRYPDLVITGGIDKRILARTKAEIDAMVDRIFPVMQERGGYIPTCDHGVPEEVPLENYLHFRKRALEFS